MQARKLRPRNATARSHHWVMGNPVTTRPEFGVDNCFPGLEFDQRNLDQRFFLGLEFELHAAAVLRAIDERLAPDLAKVITGDDVRRGLALRHLRGGAQRGQPDVYGELRSRRWTGRLADYARPGGGSCCHCARPPCRHAAGFRCSAGF